MDKLIVFIHNAGGNKHFCEDSVNYLSGQGYKLINYELLAHGSNKVSDDVDLSVPAQAESLKLRLNQEQSKQVILCGLNYGSVVAIELARLLPEKIAGVVVMDPPILMNDAVRSLVQAHVNDLLDPSIADFATDLVNEVGTYLSDRQKKTAIASFQMIPRKQLASLYQGLLRYDTVAAKTLKQLSLPVLHIQSEHPFCLEEVFKQNVPHVDTSRIVGGGHWMTMDVPQQVNAMIMRWMQLKFSK